MSIYDHEDPEGDEIPAFFQDYETKPADQDHEHMDALQVVCAVMAIGWVFTLIWVML